jgi:hypothetical protein
MASARSKTAKDGRTTYKIIKTAMGYLPLLRALSNSWQVIRVNGSLSVYLDDAPNWPEFFHADEEGAGKCINANYQMHNADVIWKSKT